MTSQLLILRLPLSRRSKDGRVVQGGSFRYYSLRRRGFEPHSLHFLFSTTRYLDSNTPNTLSSTHPHSLSSETVWPSGLRRVTRNHFSSGGVGSNPAAVVFSFSPLFLFTYSHRHDFIRDSVAEWSKAVDLKSISLWERRFEPCHCRFVSCVVTHSALYTLSAQHGR